MITVAQAVDSIHAPLGTGMFNNPVSSLEPQLATLISNIGSLFDKCQEVEIDLLPVFVDGPPEEPIVFSSSRKSKLMAELGAIMPQVSSAIQSQVDNLTFDLQLMKTAENSMARVDKIDNPTSTSPPTLTQQNAFKHVLEVKDDLTLFINQNITRLFGPSVGGTGRVTHWTPSVLASKVGATTVLNLLASSDDDKLVSISFNEFDSLIAQVKVECDAFRSGFDAKKAIAQSTKDNAVRFLKSFAALTTVAAGLPSYIENSGLLNSTLYADAKTQIFNKLNQ